MTRQFVRGWILLLAVLAGNAPGLIAQNKPIVIEIAVTTDVHGAYFPTDWLTGKPMKGSLAQVSAWVKEERKQCDGNLILLDNGDLIQGDPASYYSNFIDTGKPNIAARILNYMGYSAATIGNHDLETGHAVYDKLVRESDFPWLSANSVKAGTLEPWFTPYHMVTRAGVRVAILGLTTPKIPDWLPPVLWSGMEFTDMITTAQRWVEHIRRVEKPDLIIGLFHSGVDASYGQQSADKPLNENAARLVAERVAGFDVVFTGHDHRTWNLNVCGPDGDSVRILGSGSRAAELALASIRMKPTDNGFVPAGITGRHITMESYSPDPLFVSQFSGYMDSVREYVEQPVGILARDLNSDAVWTGPSELLGLIHEAQLELTGADLSFTAPLSFRTRIPAGPIRVKDLFNLYRFENQLYTIRLTGSEILGYLNYSYSLWMNTISSPDDLLLKMDQSPDGSWRLRNASYNFDSAAGIEYTVDVTRPSGQMVTVDRFTDGRTFYADSSYTVALNSYRGSGGGGHLAAGAGLSKQEIAGRLAGASEMDFRYLFGEWIRRQGTLNPGLPQNWKIVPEALAREASQRDTRRLLRN